MQGVQIARARQYRAPFNMIEIILALVIIVVGIIGVLGLFPTATKASKTAVNRSSAGDAGDQFLRYYVSLSKANWLLASALPFVKPADDESAANWAATDSAGLLTAMPGVVLYYNDTSNNGKYDVAAGADRDSTGLFRLQQRTATNLVDFDGVVRAWRSPATYKTYNAATNQWLLKAVPPDNGACINVEVSYPASVPYAQREKQSFVMDAYRPNGVAAAADPQGAFTTQQPSQLRVTYHGSDAGYRSVTSFWLVTPDGSSTKIFNSALAVGMDQAATFTQVWPAGASFNAYIEVAKSVQSKPSPFRHYAFAKTTDSFYWDTSSTNTGYRYRMTGSVVANRGKPYCQVIEQVPGQKWLLCFEDNAGDLCDWDYNDVTCTVELLSVSGASTYGVPISGTVSCNVGSGWELNLIEADTGIQRSSENLGNSLVPVTGLRVLCAWFRPQGSGTQSLTVNSQSTSFDNTNMVSVCDLGNSMTVNLTKSGSTWRLTLNAANATYTNLE